jgi:hypothetical protein
MNGWQLKEIQNDRVIIVSGGEEKAHHWFSYFFDKSMVLFDNIIQILVVGEICY